MSFLLQFYYQITYQPGKDNIITNILSQKDKLILTQKQAKKAKRTRQVILLDLILAFTKIKNTIPIPAFIKIERINELLVIIKVL